VSIAHAGTSGAVIKMKAQSKLARRVIVVTGTPGTGKTTFSKRLAKEIGADRLELTEFVSKHKLSTSFDRRRNSKVVNLPLVQSSLDRLFRHASGPIIVDTHLPEVIKRKDFVKLVFVLRCHPGILKKRLRRKKWAQRKIRENVLAEMLDVCLINAVEWFGRPRVLQLETSRISVDRCVASAKRMLSRPARRKVRIDWITTLEREHSLARYLER
jgi:adenylate kinase